MIGWLAVLSCAPLACSLLRPPLWLLVPLWVLAGAAGAYQLAAADAFVQALPNAVRARAFSVAQTGLLAAQGLGILAAGIDRHPAGAAGGGRHSRCARGGNGGDSGHLLDVSGQHGDPAPAPRSRALGLHPSTSPAGRR